MAGGDDVRRELGLAGKVAVVTGASRGLGRAMAVALAEAGADLALVGRAKPDLETTAATVERAGAARPRGAGGRDVPARSKRAWSRRCEALGRLDILVNNAGLAKVKPLVEWAPEEWRAWWTSTCSA